MEFTFYCDADEYVVELLRKMGLKADGLEWRAGGQCVLSYETDMLIRELYQWSAAAFACGLIESPRIERL